MGCCWKAHGVQGILEIIALNRWRENEAIKGDLKKSNGTFWMASRQCRGPCKAHRLKAFYNVKHSPNNYLTRKTKNIIFIYVNGLTNPTSWKFGQQLWGIREISNCHFHHLRFSLCSPCIVLHKPEYCSVLWTQAALRSSFSTRIAHTRSPFVIWIHREHYERENIVIAKY